MESVQSRDGWSGVTLEQKRRAAGLLERDAEPDSRLAAGAVVANTVAAKHGSGARTKTFAAGLAVAELLAPAAVGREAWLIDGGGDLYVLAASGFYRQVTMRLLDGKPVLGAGSWQADEVERGYGIAEHGPVVVLDGAR